MKFKIENVEDFLEHIKLYIDDFDTLTTATFGEHELWAKNISKEKIFKILNNLNKLAETFLLTHTYSDLQKTSLWKGGKYLLYNYLTNKDSEKINCPHCGERLIGPYGSLLHHKKYEYDHIFDPEYIEFICYLCHNKIHNK